MNLFEKLFYKKLLCEAFTTLYVDTLFRYLNRNKVLVVMYHGVCRKDYIPPIWTQLPVDLFEKQIKFLLSHYNIITLSDFISSITSGRKIPKRSALITFDDGLRNNYSVAFPILQRYFAPATFFLTMDFIDTDNVLWFDELYFLLRKIVEEDCAIDNIEIVKEFSSYGKDVWGLYSQTVERLKRVSERTRNMILERLRQKVKINIDNLLDDFGILTTRQIQEMNSSGLIDFGVHTATHQILTEMDQSEVNRELVSARQILEGILGRPVNAFCYPNGRRGTDFTSDHEDLLRQIGYRCAFATDRAFFDFQSDDPFAIGRIPAGNDFTSYPAWFRLSTAGLWQIFR